jgi:hypothetical protein
MGMPESRDPRYAERGRPQTSRYRAMKVADRSLVVRHVEPRLPDPERARAVSAEILGRGWKPQKPMIYAKLDMRPFQSTEQFLRTLETDYVPGEEKEPKE